MNEMLQMSPSQLTEDRKGNSGLSGSMPAMQSLNSIRTEIALNNEAIAINKALIENHESQIRILEKMIEILETK